jgi:hypothetical protein
MLRGVVRAWAEIEWRSVEAGLRRCALCFLPADTYDERRVRAEKLGLRAIPLRARGPSGADAKQVVVQVVIGKGRDTKAFASAWIRRDNEELGELLGYPKCCRKFFQKLFVAAGVTDPSWFIARNTSGAQCETRTVLVSTLPLLNILLRSIGVRTICHLPCRLDCPNSLVLEKQFLELARTISLSNEANWLEEMLSWPCEWSALHGIAEIRTPFMKISTRTDATAEKYIVRWKGTAYPPDGIPRQVFPWLPQNPA